MIWKLVEYGGLILYTAVIPRQMGPDLYGRFAALLSFISLLSMGSALGAQASFARFIPEYEARGEPERTKTLFVQTLCVRALVAALLSAALVWLLPPLLRDASALTIAAATGAFFLGVLATTCYQLFYGLNRLGRWLSQDALSRVVLLVLLIILAGGRSLERATIALFSVQLGFLVLGLFWTRHFITLRRTIFDFSFLRAHLQFGILFFVANLLMMGVWRGGEVIVLLLSRRSAEVAFFNLASGVSLALAVLIVQFLNIITPSLIALQVAGETQRVDTFVGYTLKYLTIAAFCFLLIVHALGPWLVQAVMGEQYLPVLVNLRILALGLVPIALVRTGISLAVVHRQPGKALRITAGALAAFLLASALLVPRFAAVGASAAVALAFGCAGMIAYRQFSLGPVLAAAHFWRTILFGVVTLGVLSLPLASGLPMAILAGALFLSLLFAGKVVSIREIRLIGQGLAA